MDIYPVESVSYLLNNWSLLRGNSNSIFNIAIYQANCNRILGKHKLDGTGQI